MIVLITGDRNWNTELQMQQVAQVFQNVLVSSYKDITIVHGDAKGVDTMAHVVAEELQLNIIRCPAHWRHNEPKWTNVYGPCPDGCKEIIGRPAGVIRNRYMLKTHRPALVIAFHNNLATSRGTKDMVTIATTAKIPVLIFTESSLVIPSSLTN